ncbi:MAG: aminotransferase class V-fold PLP-dependent enzyme, partial [Deltaproteobacteria bacterium]
MRTDSVGDINPLRALHDRRAAFAVPEDVTFLNSAHIGPRLHAVRAAEKFALDRWAMPWKLTGEDWFADTQRLRELVGRLLLADAEAMAFVPSVSYAMAIVARNVRVTRGQSIVLIHEEFPSNYYAWETAAAAAGARLKIVVRAPSQSWPDALVDAITDEAAVVSVPVCHWTDGALIGVERVGARARAMGAALVVDASQSLGMLPLDAPALDADFVIATGYKWLLGPFGLAYLYVAPRHRCGEPIEQAWPAREGSEDLSRLVEYRSSFRPGARRFDAGEHQNSLLL